MLKNIVNTLNKIKNAEIKHKKLIPGQKKLLNLFNDLSDIILDDKKLMSSKEENEKENEKLKEENGNENENKNENENENENKNEDDDDIMKILIRSNEYDEETINQNKKKL